MRALLLLPVVAGVQVLETHQAINAHVDYDGLKVTLKEIGAKQAGKHKIDDDTREEVRRILQTVNETLMGALRQDLQIQQTIFNDALSAISACDANREAWFGDGATDSNQYWGFVQAKADAKGAHEDCRDQEHHACELRNTKCNEQDATVSGIDRTMCHVPSFANGDSQEVNDFMNCFSKLICDNHERYVAGRAVCRQRCSDLSGKTAECHGLQGQYEIATCNLETAINTNCQIYRQCRFSQESSYYRTLATTREVESLLQTQRSALACLVCYGQAILNNEGSLDRCDSPPVCSTLSDCPEIVYRDPSSFIPCTECQDNLPCEHHFLSRSYSDHPTGDWRHGSIRRKPDQCIPRVTDCVTCSTPRAGGSGQSECDHDNSGAVAPNE